MPIANGHLLENAIVGADTVLTVLGGPQVRPGDRILIRLIGPFAIERAGGVNVALYGKRAKALLALLALAPNGTRSRKWLQSKLWSTRGEEQGAASLRQELFELRKSLRDAGLEVLTADRELVHLDLQSIDLDYSNDGSRGAATDDLLEALIFATRNLRNGFASSEANGATFSPNSRQLPLVPPPESQAIT